MSERYPEWLHWALDAARLGTWSWNLVTDEVVWSDRMASIFGLPEDELGATYAAFLNLVHPDDRDDVEQRIEAALREASDLYTVEHRVIWPDGTIRWVEHRGQVYRADDGRPVRMAGVAIDITERKQTKQALTRGNERLQQYNRVLTDLAQGMRTAWGNLDQSLHRITEAVAEALRVERANVWLFDEPHTRITCIDHYQRSSGHHTQGMVLEADDYPAYFDALTDARIVAAHDAREDERTSEFADDYFAAFDIQSMLDAPVRVGGELAGIICLEHVGETRTWTPEEQVLAGSAADFVAMALEAAQRKERERQLHERERQLARHKQYTDDVLDAIDDIFYVIGADHRFQRWNASFRTLVGYSDEEIASMHPLELFVMEGDQTAIETALRELFGTDSKPVEAELTTKDGTLVPYEFVSSRLEDPDGHTVEVGIGRDISERKEAEEKLRASKEYAEGLIASMQDGFSVIDTEMRQVQVNEALCRMTGFSREELVDVDPPYPYWPPEEQEVIQSAFEKTIERQRFESLELVFKRKSGERFPVLVTPSQLTNDAGEVVNYFSTMKDITERKRAEEALKQSEARLRTLVEDLRAVPMRLLEAQEQERRRIARELHDEAGGLLTSLQMCLDTAIQHVPAREEDGMSVAQEELQEARELTSTLSTQVRQMALNLRPSVLDDLGLAAALQWLADWYAKHAGLAVRLYHEIEAGQRFAETVETAAYRIVQEALTNASRHAEVEEVQVMVNVLEDRFRLHIIDEGTGFDLEQVQKEHETVGLSSMRERVELLQGALEIATAPGEGTRISATLPTHPQ